MLALLLLRMSLLLSYILNKTFSMNKLSEYLRVIKINLDQLWSGQKDLLFSLFQFHWAICDHAFSFAQMIAQIVTAKFNPPTQMIQFDQSFCCYFLPPKMATFQVSGANLES